MGFSGLEGTYYFKNFKLEKGKVPSLWCPNIADPLASSYGLDKIYDSSGFGNDGTPTNIKYTTDNKRGITSAAFESNNQSVISFNNTLSKTWEISCGCWVYKNDWNTFSGEEAIVAFTSNKGIHFNIKNESQALGTKAAIFIYDEDIQKSRFFQCGIGTDYMHNLSNGWHHIFMTSNETQLKLYIDGINSTIINETGTYDINFNRTSYIGSNSDEGFFNGKIDDFRIYTTTLSDNDVLQLYRETQKIDNQGNLYCSELNEVERRVEYLESDGSQWIDTGINCGLGYIFEFDIILTEERSLWQTFLGHSSEDNTFRYVFNKDGHLIIYENSQETEDSVSIPYNQRGIVKISHLSGSRRIEFKDRNVEYITTETAANGTFQILSSQNGQKDYMYCKLYGLRVYKDNNTLVRDFLPMISTEEGHIGEACLFDIVENKYYYNQGTGKFTTNLDESTTNIDFTSKGIVNTDYIIEGNDTVKIKNDGNIIEVNNLYEN